MAKSHLQTIAEGLQSASRSAGATADRIAADTRVLKRISGELNVPALRLAVQSVQLGGELTKVSRLIDAAGAEARRASRLAMEVESRGTAWVGQLVASGSGDSRVSAAQQRQMERWAQRSGADDDARAAKRQQVADQIFSPWVAIALTGAAVLVPPVGAVSAAYGVASVAKGSADLVNACRRLAQAQGLDGGTSAVGARRSIDHSAAALGAEIIEAAFEAFTGIDVSGAVGVSADTLHRVRNHLANMGHPGT